MAYVLNGNETKIAAALLGKSLPYGDFLRLATAELSTGKLSAEGFTLIMEQHRAAEIAATKAAAPAFEHNEWGVAFPMKGKRFGKLELTPEQVDKLATIGADGALVPSADFLAFVRFVAENRAAIQSAVDEGRAAYDAKKAQEKLSKLTPAQRAILAKEAAKAESTAA